MPNLRPLAEQHLAMLQQALGLFASQQAKEIVTKLALVVVGNDGLESKSLIATFQTVRDTLSTMSLKSLAAICQAFLDNAHPLIATKYNEQHPFLMFPYELFLLILMPKSTPLDLSVLVIVAQVSQKFRGIAQRILADYYPKPDYRLLARLVETLLFTGTVFHQHRALVYTDHLLIRNHVHHELRIERLLQTEYADIFPVGGKTWLIATTPNSDAVLLGTPTGFEIWDVSSQQLLPCANALLTSPAVRAGILSAKSNFALLLPDKKTLLHIDQSNLIHFNDLMATPYAAPHMLINLNPITKNRYPMMITPNKRYLVIAHAQVFQGLSVLCLETKTLYQRLLPSQKIIKNGFCFQGFTVSYDSRSVAAVYENNDKGFNRSVTVCLQWEINQDSVQKATEISLCNRTKKAQLEKIRYTLDGAIVGLFTDTDNQPSGVEIKIWNRQNGQCVYQHVLPNLNRGEVDLCLNSKGEIMLIDEKQNAVKTLRYPLIFC